MHTYYIENLGCSKNQVDAEQMADYLSMGNWKLLSSPEGAEVILINTCGFVESAREESIQVALEFRTAFPDVKILMSGCMAERYSKELMESMPEVDGFFGNKDLSQIERIMDRVIGGERFAVIPQLSSDDQPQQGVPYGEQERTALRRKNFFSFPRSAYVKLSEGCNHNCAYCAIPLIRGSLVSRPFHEVLSEIQSLIEDGIFEINLIAQDLASFGNDRGEPQFVTLLEEISKLQGDFWVRMLYIHPDNFPWDIIPVMKKDPRILPYFDIPIQHVDPAILAPMGRTGSTAIYGELVAKLREAFPKGAIRTTFLLGFPGENKETLESLVLALPEISFDWAGFFIYSPEEGTKAISLCDETAQEQSITIAKEYLPRLQEIQSEITTQRMATRVGDSIDLFVEEPIEGEDLSFGRTFFQAPEVDGCVVITSGDLTPGSVVSGKIINSSGPDLTAEVLS